MSPTMVTSISNMYDHFDDEIDLPNTTMDSPSQSQSADGILVIMVVRAKHLPNRRKLDKQSPYVVIRLGTTAKKTKSDFRAGQTPEWTHELRFEIAREKKPLLKIDLLDETKGDPTPIGSCEIDASQVFSDLGNKRDGKYILDKWYDLAFQGKRAGMLYLEMTFYPSAPVLPPKVPYHEEEYHVVDGDGDGGPYGGSLSPVQSPPPQSYYYESNPLNDVFVSLENSKHSKRSSIFLKTSQYFISTNEGSASSHENPDEVIILHPKVGSKSPNKYMSKFNKIKDKFQSKQSIWGKPACDSSTSAFFSGPSRRNISPISVYGSGDLDELEQDLSRSHIGQNQKLDDFDLDLEFKAPPPPPPPHQSHSKPLPAPPGRKPPSPISNINLKDSTSIPFSADSIGLDDNVENLPTKVYLLDEPVKSLTCNAKHNVNLELPIKDEIDPKYFAPTPSEHFNRQMRFSNNAVTKDDLKVDLRTTRTGYVGNGKFSPSVFQKASINKPFNVYDDSDDDEEEPKPEVPPKIPKGLNEMEYYILEKEKYLRDLQARRA